MNTKVTRPITRTCDGWHSLRNVESAHYFCG